MTDLARRYQRPGYPRRDTSAMLLGVLLVGVGSLGGFLTVMSINNMYPGDFFSALGMSAIPAVLGAALLYIYERGTSAHNMRVRQWKIDVDYLDNAWMCHRCGHDWDPERG